MKYKTKEALTIFFRTTVVSLFLTTILYLAISSLIVLIDGETMLGRDMYWGVVIIMTVICAVSSVNNYFNPEVKDKDE